MMQLPMPADNAPLSESAITKWLSAAGRLAIPQVYLETAGVSARGERHSDGQQSLCADEGQGHRRPALG